MEYRNLGRYSVVSIASPSKFFLRSEAQQLNFTKLKESLKQAYDNTPMGMGNFIQEESQNEFFRMSKGDPVVVKHKSIFKRAVLVSDWTGGCVELYLKDEGTVEEVPSANCFRGSSRCDFYPPFVTRCHLHDIGPNDFSPDIVRNFMVECLEKHPLVTVIERGPCMKMPDGEQSLAVEIAIDVKIVDTPFSEIKTVPKYLSQLLLKAGLSHYFNPLEVPWDLNFKDEPPLTDHTDLEGRGLEQAVRWQGPVYPVWKLNEERSVMVNNVDRCGQVYVTQLEDAPVLEQMASLFQDFYGSVNEDFDCWNGMFIRKTWKINEDCVFFWEEFAIWERARIIKVNETLKSYQVLLVDLGLNLDSQGGRKPITFRHLRVPYHFGHVPILSLRLILADVVPTQFPRGQYKWADCLWEEMLSLFKPSTGGSSKVVATKMECLGKFPIVAKIVGHLRTPVGAKERFDASTFLVENHWTKLKKGKFDFSSVQRSLDLEAFSIQALKQKPPKIEKINFQDLNELPPPEKPKALGNASKVYVTYANEKSSTFFVRFYIQNEEFVTVMDDISIEAPNWPPAPLEKGCLVAFNRNGNKYWYRGIILRVNDELKERTAQIYLFDVGEVKENVDPTSLKLLRTSYLGHPIMCFRVKHNPKSQVSESPMNVRQEAKMRIEGISFPSAYDIAFDSWKYTSSFF